MQRRRIAKAKERARELLAAARARAKLIVETARERARALLAKAMGKQAPTKTKRRPKPKPTKRKAKRRAMRQASFAEQVLLVVRSKRPKKFGPKAFIASVWDVNFAPHFSLPAFKAELIKAHRSGELELSRADLVSAMDPTLVERSSTSDGLAEYHFIRPEPRALKVK